MEPAIKPRKNSVIRSAWGMAVGTFSSRILGFIRDALMFALFPRAVTDAFVVAFRLPNLFRRLLGEGSISVGFIPLYIETRARSAEEAEQLAGLIATNTTLDHSAVPAAHDQTGGLSGAPLISRSTEVLRILRAHTALPIIASGGVMSADCARKKLEAGASLVQIYTGFIYRGPQLIREIANIWPSGSR